MSDATFMDPPFRDPTPPDLKPNNSTTTPSRSGSSSANKRKRPSDSTSTDHRSATARRTSANPAPTANMADAGDTTSYSGAGGSSDFDLSALENVAHHGGGVGSNGSHGAGGAHQGSSANIDTAAAALSQHYSMQVPPHPAEGFMNQPTAGGGEYGLDGADGQVGGYRGMPGGVEGSPGGGQKPAVGSDEWHKVRKDNHKEVERRRRETINEGINELAKIVPGCEKNKGSILARAVQYIQRLHDDATANIDKWTFEKVVTETAIAEISEKQTRTYFEKEAWRKVARDAGVDVDAEAVLGKVRDEVDGGVRRAQEVQQAQQQQQQQQQAQKGAEAHDGVQAGEE